MSLFDQARPNPRGHRDVSPAEVWAQRGAALLVDVRAPEEFTGELGHVPGSILVPMAQVDDAALDWPRDRDVVLICRSGNRSGRAAEALAAQGYRVMNMVGGMLAWRQLGLPVE